MSLYSLLYMLSSNPLPGAGKHTYLVELGTEPLEPSLLRITDSTALGKIAQRFGNSIIVGNLGFAGLKSQNGDDFGQSKFRAVTNGFFSSFNVPIIEGRIWNSREEEAGVPVAALKESAAKQLFGDQDPIGRNFRFGGSSFRVIALISDDWQPTPKFYDLASGAYGQTEPIFIPLHAVRYLTDDSKSFITFTCEGGHLPPKPSNIASSQCLWTSLWVDINSDEAKSKYMLAVDAYRLDHSLRNYARPRLLSVGDVIDQADVVPGSVKLYSLLSFGFLGLCIINASGVLLAKYLRRGTETGVRRALGASRIQIFLQFLTESIATSMLGGVLGFLLTLAGIRLIKLIPESYTHLATLNINLLAIMLIAVIGSGSLCGIIPALLASRGSPADVLRKGAQ